MLYYHNIFLLEFNTASLPFFACNGSKGSYAAPGSITFWLSKYFTLLVLYIGVFLIYFRGNLNFFYFFDKRKTNQRKPSFWTAPFGSFIYNLFGSFIEVKIMPADLTGLPVTTSMYQPAAGCCCWNT